MNNEQENSLLHVPCYLLLVFMLMIRLQRIGKKKQPTYRFVVSEKRHDTQGKNQEMVGFYQPTLQPKVLSLKKERIEYWLSVGAQTSATVHNILLKEGLVQGVKRRSVKVSRERKEKLAKKAGAESKTGA